MNKRILALAIASASLLSNHLLEDADILGGLFGCSTIAAADLPLR